MEKIVHNLLGLNAPLLGINEDYLDIFRATRGIEIIGGETGQNTGSTVLIECRPIPFKSRAKFYRDDLDVLVSSIRRTPPSAKSPRAKTNSHLNQILSDREVKKAYPRAYALMVDERGNIAEGPSFLQVPNMFTI